MLVGTKAVSFSGRNSGLVVESLGSTHSKLVAGSDPVEELGFVVAKRACELPEVLVAGA